MFGGNYHEAPRRVFMSCSADTLQRKGANEPDVMDEVPFCQTRGEGHTEESCLSLRCLLILRKVELQCFAANAM
jgi:hypothetical protein